MYQSVQCRDESKRHMCLKENIARSFHECGLNRFWWLVRQQPLPSATIHDRRFSCGRWLTRPRRCSTDSTVVMPGKRLCAARKRSTKRHHVHSCETQALLCAGRPFTSRLSTLRYLSGGSTNSLHLLGRAVHYQSRTAPRPREVLPKSSACVESALCRKGSLCKQNGTSMRFDNIQKKT